MTTKQKCEKLAEEKGVDLLLAKGWYNSYDLHSPKGLMFGNGCHAVYGEADTMKEIWQGVWEDLTNLQPCTTPDCYNCKD